MDNYFRRCIQQNTEVISINKSLFAFCGYTPTTQDNAEKITSALVRLISDATRGILTDENDTPLTDENNAPIDYDQSKLLTVTGELWGITFPTEDDKLLVLWTYLLKFSRKCINFTPTTLTPDEY